MIALYECVLGVAKASQPAKNPQPSSHELNTAHRLHDFRGYELDDCSLCRGQCCSLPDTPRQYRVSPEAVATDSRI
jgi:hypothetical protein